MKILLICTFALFTNYVLAQNNDTIKVIKGLVFDMEYQKPLPGIAIRVKGTTNQTVTDIEGKPVVRVLTNHTNL